MKRVIIASMLDDEELAKHWSDGTEYEGDLLGLCQDVMNHYQRAFELGSKNAWGRYYSWLSKTAKLFPRAFTDPQQLEDWAFHYNSNGKF